VMAPLNANGTDEEPYEGYSESGPFSEERPGWKGYVEWENCPDKKEKAAKILASHTFPPVSPFSQRPISPVF
jgi:sulfite oxidase